MGADKDDALPARDGLPQDLRPVQADPLHPPPRGVREVRRVAADVLEHPARERLRVGLRELVAVGVPQVLDGAPAVAGIQAEDQAREGQDERVAGPARQRPERRRERADAQVFDQSQHGSHRGPTTEDGRSPPDRSIKHETPGTCSIGM